MSSGYEKTDVNIGKLSIIGFIIVFFIIASLILVDIYFVMEKEAVMYETVLKPRSVALEKLLANEEKVLTSYQLVDSTKQVYSIPIENAMELYRIENMKPIPADPDFDPIILYQNENSNSK